jgi:hypothetical protein
MFGELELMRLKIEKKAAKNDSDNNPKDKKKKKTPNIKPQLIFCNIFNILSSLFYYFL